MKIAILTSGRLPIPAIKGGAVETKIDYTLAYNAVHHLVDITVYSVKPETPYTLLKSPNNHYVHIDIQSISFKLGRYLYHLIHKKGYYDSFIEFFLHLCIKKFKRYHYDVIIAANRPGYVQQISRITNTPIILQLNNDFLNPNTQDAHIIKDNCAGIITCSNYINERASSVPCRRNVPVYTVYNGIDITRFVNALPIKRETIGLEKDDYVIIYTGRIIKEKGVLELIRSIKALNDIPRLRLMIVGASFYGQDEAPSPYIQELKDEAMDIKEKVIFTGYIDYVDIPSYIKTANIAVLPSMWDEPFGLTILEAMAAGLPLITTRSGGIPEICEGAAILLDRDNIVQNITRAIRYLYTHTEKAKELGRIAQEKSMAFDKDVFSSNYLEAVSKIIKQDSHL